MKKWILKAIVQKAISYLPYSHRINYLFQKYVTKGIYLNDEYFEDRLNHAKTHIDSYEKYADKKRLNRTLEIGTGWYPVVPIALFLYGANDINTVDISLHTNTRYIHTTIDKFLELEKQGRLSSFVNYKPERLEILKKISAEKSDDFESLINRLYITYLIRDARDMRLPDNTFDLVNSNNTFEHIPGLILKGILKEFIRVTRTGGVMSHFIDMSDHFAHFDKEISIYNFLQFSQSKWKWIDNTIQPMNRLRIGDYKRMYAELNIPIDQQAVRKGDPDELSKIKIDPEYLVYPMEEIAVSHCHFISIKKTGVLKSVEQARFNVAV